jgi:hypothetical protein
LTDCRIRNNVAVSEAGGIEVEDGASIALVSSQIVGNHAKKGAGVVIEDDQNFGPSSASAQGTTIMKNAQQDCLGTIASLGGNRDSDGSCRFGPAAGP